jgi:hypothetical protein
MLPRRKYSVLSLLLLFLLQHFPFSVYAQDGRDIGQYGDPTGEHLRPCLESIPDLPPSKGNVSIQVLDRGDSCSILMGFELQSDLDNYRLSRWAAKLSLDSVTYKRPDGSVMEIELVLRKTAVHP